MRDVYGEQFDTSRAEAAPGLIPETLRRLVGAALFLGLILAMGLWSWRLGTRDATEVPVVRAMAGPARVVPEDPGGTQAPHQGLEVNAVLAGQPAPEPQAVPVAPEPPALAPEDKPQAELALVVTAPEEPEPDPVAVPQAEAEAIASPQSETDRLIAELGAETPSDATVGLAPFTLPEDAALEVAVVEPMPPGPRPRGRPAGLRAARAPAPAAQPVAETRVAAATPETAAVGPGSRLVQLGAFDSAVSAREAWNRLVGRHGDLLGSKSLFVERTTANARVFYRLRVAGFADNEATRSMCEALKARGVDCIPVTLQ